MCLQEKDTILVESYARIKYLQTHTWLHLDKGTYIIKRKVNMQLM